MALVGLLAGFVPAVTRGADAEDHYTRGILLLQHGCTAEALREYELAYGAKGYPRLLYRIGVLRQELGQTAAAQEALRRFLATDRNIDEETRADVARRLGELQDRSERPTPAASAPCHLPPGALDVAAVRSEESREAAARAEALRRAQATRPAAPPRPPAPLPRHRVYTRLVPAYLAPAAGALFGEVAYAYRHRSSFEVGVAAPFLLHGGTAMSGPGTPYARYTTGAGLVLGQIGFSTRWVAIGLLAGSGYLGVPSTLPSLHVQLGLAGRIGRLDATHVAFRTVFPVLWFLPSFIDLQLHIPLKGRFWLGITGTCTPGLMCMLSGALQVGPHLEIHLPAGAGPVQHILTAGVHCAILVPYSEHHDGGGGMGPALFLSYERRIY